jgi:succinate dehydrogenase / fumarate reductase iron-sulfur subunit
MVTQMDLEHFGGCTLFGECQEACPKEISIDTITRMNRDYAFAMAAEASEGKRSSGAG